MLFVSVVRPGKSPWQFAVTRNAKVLKPLLVPNDKGLHHEVLPVTLKVFLERQWKRAERGDVVNLRVVA